MALDLRQNFVSAQYLKNKLTDFHQILYMHWYWQDLAWDFYTSFFENWYQSYCPICQNFVSTQYLENRLVEFHQILYMYMHSYWQDLAWDCYMSFFAHLYQSYGPWFTPKFRLPSISREKLTDFHQILYTRVIFYVRRIGLYLYKYRIYGTISIYILKGLPFFYQLI